ncbi:N-acetylglucosamine kinase [Alkalihalobacillus sp. CinArs1]|uniref:N-acetylglucosamine kinase n=1 Tax=Alkalihalobacillus sp. CinArs1 TaxID=2995314 RepID=UPI0022DCF050|nr:BadF/BadG/BcrA/BcrD ATPase family protein [Alkalihalobacillus sp. CinArs1]
MRSSKTYVIGIDGGGTKTEALLCNEDGTILAKSRSGSTNIKSRSEEEVCKEIQQVIEPLTCNLVKSDVDVIYVSAAGGDRPEDQKRWKKWLLESLPEFNGTIMVTNDAYGALASGTYSMEGTVLIAGTGSIAYSITRGQPPVRAGGWGYLFGDDGSGYAIGRQALKVVSEMHDGIREKDERFIEGILSSLALNDVRDIITSIYEDTYPRLKIASLAAYVIKLGNKRNHTALFILEDACDSLRKLVEAVHDAESIVLSGGLFQSDLFRKMFERNVQCNGLNHRLVVPDLSPASGACICAFLTKGALTQQMKKNLTSSYHSM